MGKQVLSLNLMYEGILMYEEIAISSKIRCSEQA